MQCSSEYDLCSAKSVSSEKEASLIDKTYRYQCRLYYGFYLRKVPIKPIQS